MAFFESPNLPPAISRLRRWYWLMLLGPLAGAVRSHYWASLPDWAKSGWVSFAPLIAMAAGIAAVRVLEARIRRRARAADDRLCPGCLYPLEGEAGVCPECGRPFSISGLHDTWQAS